MQRYILALIRQNPNITPCMLSLLFWIPRELILTRISRELILTGISRELILTRISRELILTRISRELIMTGISRELILTGISRELTMPQTICNIAVEPRLIHWSHLAISSTSLQSKTIIHSLIKETPSCFVPNPFHFQRAFFNLAYRVESTVTEGKYHKKYINLFKQ